MEYNYDKAKAVLDKSFKMVKIPFHKDSPASDITRRCQEVVWGDSQLSNDSFDYYLADGTGMAIDAQDQFVLDKPDGSSPTSVPWTLYNYLQVSNVKYPSRARIYCVRKLSPCQ